MNEKPDYLIEMESRGIYVADLYRFGFRILEWGPVTDEDFPALTEMKQHVTAFIVRNADDRDALPTKAEVEAIITLTRFMLYVSMPRISKLLREFYKSLKLNDAGTDVLDTLPSNMRGILEVLAQAGGHMVDIQEDLDFYETGAVKKDGARYRPNAKDHHNYHVVPANTLPRDWEN
jgi:hypothetical protein